MTLDAPGPHGGDGNRIATQLGLDASDIIDLSASMNPFAPDVRQLLRDLLHTDGGNIVGTYPDATAATNALALAMGVDPDVLVLTNGGAEAIALLAGVLQSGNVIQPEFSLYERHLTRIDTAAPRWRSNPSNPLGTLAAPTDDAYVWDEAFYPIATGAWSRGDTNSWRLGSLTKLWNCPGLRLGYAIAPTATDATALRSRQPQWAVNGLALALVVPLLEQTDLQAWSTAIAGLRASFSEALAKLGYSVRSSTANWVLVDAANLRSRLAPKGIVVRDCASFGMTDVARVAIPRPDQFDRVLQGFTDVGESQPGETMGN